MTPGFVSARSSDRTDSQRQPEPRSRNVVALAETAVQALGENVVREELLNERIGAREDVDAAAASHPVVLIEQEDDRQCRIGVSSESDELCMRASGERVDQGKVALAVGREGAVQVGRHRHPVRLA